MKLNKQTVIHQYRAICPKCGKTYTLYRTRNEPQILKGFTEDGKMACGHNLFECVPLEEGIRE